MACASPFLKSPVFIKRVCGFLPAWRIFTFSSSGSPTFSRQVLCVVILQVSRRYISGTESGFAPDAAKLVPELHKVIFVY